LTLNGLWVRGFQTWYFMLGNLADVLEALIGALLVRRLVGVSPRFEGLRETALYAASVLVAAAVSATWSAGARVAGGGALWPFWPDGSLGGARAALLLPPAISLGPAAPSSRPPALPRRRVAGALALGVALLLAGLVAFGTEGEETGAASALLSLPVPA